MKKWSLLVSIIVTICLVTACSSNGGNTNTPAASPANNNTATNSSDNSSDTPEDIELRIMWWGDQERADKTNQVIELFEAKYRSEEHTSELQSREKLVCRLLLEKKN